MHEDYGDYPLSSIWWEQYEFDHYEDFDWDEDYQPSEEDLSRPVGRDGFYDGSPFYEEP